MTVSGKVIAEGAPFDEAIKYFRQKVPLPTRRWTDLWEGMHARAFVVAGAMKSDLLSDFRTAMDKAIAEGTTLSDFREAFDDIVARHGWSYRGSRGWRSALIFNTNCRTAYQAGHYEQMREVAAERPWWRYVAVQDSRTRPEHLTWHNTVLRHDDPWWKTHYPPNGWGCRCTVVSLDDADIRELESEGEKLDREAPETKYKIWTDRATGESRRVPAGIDPGWAYNVGEAAWGQQLSDEAFRSYKAMKGDAWEPLTTKSWADYGRPAAIPADTLPDVSPGKRLGSASEAAAAVSRVIGGRETVFDVKGVPVNVNAATLAQHMDLDRTPFIPFIPELLRDPFEVWMAFEKHKGTGRVALRVRIIRAFSMGKDRAFLMVAQGQKGIFEGWTFVPVGTVSYLGKQRVGKLVWGR